MEASFALDRETMTWTEFGEASRGLAKQVAESGFRPDLVLAIIDCEYVFRRTDRWIDFPWSTEPPVW